MKGAGLLFLAAALVAGCETLESREVERPPAAETGTGAGAPSASPAPSPRGVAPEIAALAGAGPVCGDPRVIGVQAPPIKGAQPGCGAAAPVRLARVAGVALSGKAVVNCAAATALADWVEDAAQPAAARLLSERLVAMRPAAGYACRPRNGKKGAKLSEHAKGNAIDIAEFIFASGETLSVRSGWGRLGPRGKYLRTVWAGACGPFGTVLGPEADRHHLTHFHFDTARYRNGDYCR